jgi:hypothetical protein
LTSDARFDFDIEARELDSVSLSATFFSLAPTDPAPALEREGKRDRRALNNFRMFSSYMARMADYAMRLSQPNGN